MAASDLLVTISLKAQRSLTATEASGQLCLQTAPLCSTKSHLSDGKVCKCLCAFEPAHQPHDVTLETEAFT